MSGSPMQCTLSIHQLELSVLLGKTQIERQTPQTIFIDLKILFLSPPETCITDDLALCPCYDELIQHIITYCAKRSFCSIEYFSCSLHQFIKEQLHPYSVLLEICVTKHPLIQIIDRVCFTCSE